MTLAERRAAVRAAFETLERAHAAIQALPDDAGDIQRSTVQDDFDRAEAEHRSAATQLQRAEDMEARRQALPPAPDSGIEPRGAEALGDTRGVDVLTRSQSIGDWARRNAAPGFHAPDTDSDLSFDRLVRGMVTGNWEGSEAEQRALSETPATAGGNMVPSPLSATVIDKARAQARVFQAGALTVPMTSSTLKLARLTAEPTPAWRNEAAAINDQAMTFDSVTLTAQTLAVLIKCSIELFEDAEPSAVIEDSFAKAIGLELDRVALRGSGAAPEPRGILNQTGVTLTAHGANGSVIGSPPAAGTMGWEFLAQAIGAVRGSNFEPTGQILAPRTEQSLGLLRDTTNQYIVPPRLLESAQRYTTNQVPINLTVGTSNDCSEVYTGQFDQLLIGIRTSFSLKFLGERFIDNGQYAFMAYLRGDVQLAHPAAFVVDTGVRS